MSEARTTRFGPKDLLRYAAVVCAALAVAYGARVWDQASNDVVLSYRGAPPGPLAVDIRDDDGERMRRTEFSASARRSHTVQLPLGTFEARMRVGETQQRARFVVHDDGAIEIDWPTAR